LLADESELELALELELDPESAGAADATGAASLPSLLLSLPVLALAGCTALDFDLWSVTYQPEPLKTIPAGVMTLRS